MGAQTDVLLSHDNVPPVGWSSRSESALEKGLCMSWEARHHECLQGLSKKTQGKPTVNQPTG